VIPAAVSGWPASKQPINQSGRVDWTLGDFLSEHGWWPIPPEQELEESVLYG
jgi:hypothetical protein